MVSPTNNQVFLTNSLVVSGTSSSDDGVKEIRLRLGSSGDFGVVDGTTNWTTNLTGLSEGTNVIYVFAVSISGKYSLTNEVYFIVDLTLPSLAITNITNYHIITSNSITVSGIASDNSGIKEVRFRLGSTGNFGIANGTTSWNTNLSSLPEGTNELHFFTISSNDEYSTTNQLYLIIDLTPPSLSINQPTNNQILTTNFTLVLGSASDNIKVKEVWLRLGSSGSFGKVSGTTSWSTNLENLQEGTNVIYAYAIDEAGWTNNVISNVFVVALNVYVSTSGNDANLGISKNLPVRTIQKGLEIAGQYGIRNVLVSSGSYTPGNGLNSTDSGVVITNNNINLAGGWNITFTSRTGYSLLDGMNNLYHIILSTNVSNIFIDGFIITKGLANGSSDIEVIGGGVFFSNVSHSVISNCIISNNSASYYGGGIGLMYSHSNIIISNIITFNTNNDKGGGIYLEGANNNLIASIFISNISLEGGGIFINSSYGNTISSSIISNRATSYGGGIYLFFSDNNLIQSSSIANNTSSSSGGGIYIENSSGNTVRSTIVSNSSSLYGGGVYLYSSYSNVIDSLVGYNISGSGGGIYLDNSTNNFISNLIISNVSTAANSGGGGITLNFSHYNTISAEIVSNYVIGLNSRGGGARLQNSLSNIINSSFRYNSSGNNAGGLHLVGGSSFNTVLGEFISNTSLNGSAIYIEGGGSNTVSSLVLRNTVSANFGAIYIIWSAYNVISNSQILLNTANNTSGIYIISSPSNIIISSVFANDSGDTGGIFANNVKGLWIIDNIFTNCGPNKVIRLNNVTDGLVISNCLIGGSSATTTTGIFEESDISAHILVENKFATNTLKVLYREGVPGTDINDINIINNNLNIDALISTNNTVTNL
ncbi:MAG: Ig-like domain-containing protein [Spirochaetes bacterium]|nr:Ig-like domain-containing protein [Spirochaetota bacterium]